MFEINDKNFNKDIIKILDKLKAKEKFAFSKYADGEFAILKNIKITNCDNWTFDPNKHNIHRDELMKSFQFHEENYFVGISCPCCVSSEDVKWMRGNVGVSESSLTWANIFVNGNYTFFKDNFIPEFNNHEIILIANENAKIDNLPFKIEKHIKIKTNAWLDNFDLLETLPKEDYKNKLFLFCAGPLGNMLVAKMWKENKNNIYLDIGSTLNPWLTEANRGYLKGAQTLYKNCKW